MDTSQMLRGALDLVVLAVLADDDGYGYDVLRRLRQAGLTEVGDASVYGTLRRLSKAGHLLSYTAPSAEGPDRRYYGLTPLGRDQLTRSAKAWSAFSGAVDDLIRTHVPGEDDMTMTQPDPLLEAYVLRVGAALGDVEPTERHALLADLRLHLDEVGRDDVRRLDDIVGPPEVYAEELRAATGLAAAAGRPPVPAGPPVAPPVTAAAWPWVRDRLAGGVRTVAGGWRDVRGALIEALVDGPAWWLSRAYLAVHVLGALTGSQGAVLLPQVFHERLWGLVALFALAVVSVRVGRDPDLVPARIVRLVTVVVVVAGVVAMVQADMHHG